MITAILPQKINSELKSFIVRAVEEVLSDPDFGLELSEKAKRRLRENISSKWKNVPFSEIKKKYY